MDDSLFARLSPEIRNRIYEYAFTSDFAVTLRAHGVEHALTQTCVQIRRETLAMFFTMTRFNAHLDDGPAAPLAHWLRALGAEVVLLINQINLWDLHDLNATLYGEEATQRMMTAATGDDEAYFLRPIGNLVLGQEMYLRDVILALQSIDLELAQFCLADKDDEESGLILTSRFAIVRTQDLPR